MIKFCLFAASLFLLNFSNPASQDCHLKLYIVTGEEDTDTTSYKYDGKTRMLTELNTDYSRETFSYTDGLLTSIYEALPSNNYQNGFTHDCFYNEKSQMEQVIDYDDLRITNFYQTFSYDSKNRLVQHTWYETPFMQDTAITTYVKYYYEGDKMIRKEEFAEYPEPTSPPKYTYVYEYAAQKNPTYPQYSVYVPSLTEKYVVTKVVCTDGEGAPVNDYSFLRDCSYNEAGYPLTCVVKYLDGTEKEKETYIYDYGN